MSPPPAERDSEPLEFLKVEGAGNDFLLVDGRQQAVAWDARRIRRLCDRRRGAGADGLLYLRETDEGLLVDYWNADGGPAAFCGNGARCVALYLFESDPANEVAFRLGDVHVVARRAGAGRIRIAVGAPEGRDVNPRTLRGRPRGLAREVARAALVDAGVAHLVLDACGDLQRRPAREWGPPLRPAFRRGRGGVNVSLVFEHAGEWRLRTFERGVEEETQACGSAVVAAAWCLERWGGARLPVALRTTGGDALAAGVEEGRGWFLEGPARIVYRGRTRGEKAAQS